MLTNDATHDAAGESHGNESVGVSSSLRVHGLCMEFEKRPVLKDVSLTFEPGLTHGLVGHNGSGKSTLIKIIAGYHRPTQGTVTLGGETVALGSAQVAYSLGLRFVFQELGLVPEFTALENFGIGPGYSLTRRRMIEWKAQRRRLRTALDLLQTEMPEDVPVASLTSVERAFVAIARAIAPGPDGSTARFLMLDEPTTALEGPETERLLEVVRRLVEDGVGVLYVSHQLDEIIAHSHVITVLRDGNLIETRPSSGTSHDALVRSMLGDELGEDALTAGVPDHQEVKLVRPSPLGASRTAFAVRGLRSARLRDASFSVQHGECVGAVGLSGSGREELIYALAGGAPATLTGMEIDGASVKGLKPSDCRRHRIAIVPGNRLPGSLVRDFSIQENLSFASLAGISRLGGLVDREKERELAKKWIADLDIMPAIPSYECRHLSGGNKQKVILAKWLETAPMMLLVDEPTAGVDVSGAHKILERLRELVDGGMAILMTTSEVSDVLTIADRVLVFNRGTLVDTISRGDGEWSEERIVQSMTGAAPSASNEQGERE